MPDTITKDDLKLALSEVLEERRTVEAETHAMHHTWIEAQIQKDRERIEMYAALKKAAATWLMIGILTALATKIWTGHWPAQ